MTAEGDGQQFEYKVSTSKHVLNEFVSLHFHANEGGHGPKLLKAVEQIYERLRRNPRDFGEPRFRLAARRLLVFQGAISPVAVEYAVHDELPHVFIRNFKLMSLS